MWLYARKSEKEDYLQATVEEVLRDYTPHTWEGEDIVQTTTFFQRMAREI